MLKERDKYKAIIIGLGRIGFSYDENKNKNSNPRSHLGSILANNAFSEICGVDVNTSIHGRIKKIFTDSRLYVLDHIPIEKRFDVGVISTPSEFREDVIKEVIKCQIKVLIIEKPLSLTLEEAFRIKKILSPHNITVRVNFHRRFDPEYIKLKPMLTADLPKMVLLKYCKGVLNYGVHHIDLLIDWFGEVETVNAIDRNVTNLDRSLSFSCIMKSGLQVVVLGVDEIDYDQFEMEIFYKDSKVSFKNGGRNKTISHGEKDRYFKGYKHLGDPKNLLETNGLHGLENLYSSIVENLSIGDELYGCEIEEAIYGLKVIHALEKSAKNNCLPQKVTPT